jgi:hypothetical protein
MSETYENRKFKDAKILSSFLSPFKIVFFEFSQNVHFSVGRSRSFLGSSIYKHFLVI